MRFPRPRFTVRQGMISIAIAAASWAALLALLRPYPWLATHNGGYNVAWSDGTSTWHARSDEAPLGRTHRFSPLVLVTWPDGSISLHLRCTPRCNRPPARRDDPPLGIPEVRDIWF